MRVWMKVVGLLTFMAVGAGIVWFGKDMRSQSRMAQTWPETRGTIIRSQWWNFEREEADIAYHFDVDGQTFVSDQVFIGTLENGRIVLQSGRKVYQYQLLDRFPVGKQVTVFYDPDEPENAVLFSSVESHGDIITYFGLAFVLVGGIGLLPGGAAWKQSKRKA